MDKQSVHKDNDAVAGIYRESDDFQVNLGEKTVHAKRMPGMFRNIKNMGQSLWLLFFLVPYIRWDGKQAVLFNIEESQFRFFSITVLAQDIWMLALLLILLAMTLFAVTSVASRVWCGYVCFQTAWTDWFTWIEDKIEGAPNKRRKLDAAGWSGQKIAKKSAKHGLWALLSLLTGISFSIWFMDAFEYWQALFSLQLPLVGWVTLLSFFLGTYLLAGVLREQTCMWLCPYARIQGVMTDNQTILPTYDYTRGEPRGKLSRKNPDQGDCIDCYQCVQVCPTGVDIRKGQQLGCITCGLCIDACDSVMDKVGKPRGLIRYASLDEVEGIPVKKLWQHPRTFVYIGIIVLSLSGIVYGLTHMGSLNLRVIPERQPLFVKLSDGSIRNQYQLKVLNKTDHNIQIGIKVEGGVPGQILMGVNKEWVAKPATGSSFRVFVKAPRKNIQEEITPIRFTVFDTANDKVFASYETKFNGPEL